MKRFQKVEIDDELGILMITDINGYQMRYLLGDDGNLILGKVYMQIAKTGQRVTMFIPAGGDMPEILKIVMP